MPYNLLELIEITAKSTQYGQLDLSLGVHDGKVKYVLGNEHQTKNFGTSGMNEAVQYLLQAIAQEHNSNHTGALTVTLEFNAGVIKKAHIHRAFRHNLTVERE